jgi:hypothetical protein
MVVLNGACHCGAVAVSLETDDASRLKIRLCQCSFCRRHGGSSVSDPAGRLTIRASEPALTRYRFGLGTADFLLCSVCGCYVGAIVARGAEARGIANPVGTMMEGVWDRPGVPVDYEGEGEAERVARRLSQWTPVSRLGGPAAAGG